MTHPPPNQRLDPRANPRLDPSHGGHWRGRLFAVLLPIVALLVVAGACTSSGDAAEDGARPTVTPTSEDRQGRLYTATWTVNAEAIGKDGPGYPYQFVEIMDDEQGVFFVSGPQHLALQTSDRVVFCAGTDQLEARCASTTRPQNNPNVMSLGLSVVRAWHPEAIYEVADYRRLKVTADSDPTRWSEVSDVVAGNSVDCFLSQNAEATPDGLRICYTDDENRLLASVDMNGDQINELQLDSYDPRVDDDRLELDYDILDDPKRYEQLLVIFPDVPVTSTPVPTDEDGNPIPEGEIVGDEAESDDSGG